MENTENRFLRFQWRNILETEWSVNRVESERLFKFVNLDFVIGLNKVWTLARYYLHHSNRRISKLKASNPLNLGIWAYLSVAGEMEIIKYCKWRGEVDQKWTHWKTFLSSREKIPSVQVWRGEKGGWATNDSQDISIVRRGISIFTRYISQSHSLHSLSCEPQSSIYLMQIQGWQFTFEALLENWKQMFSVLTRWLATSFLWINGCGEDH